jgi:HK97 family phage portal protein
MWSYVVTCLALHGNAYLFMTRTAKGDVVELLPVSPNNVSILLDGNKIRYSVTVGEAANKRTLILSNKELLHFKGLTLDGYTGISPIAYNSSLITGEQASVEFAKRVITEGATPRGVLQTDGVLSDDAFTNLKESWNAAHGGVNNGNRVALLESGVTYSPISMSPNDIGLLDGRKYNRAEIAGIFRVPPHMIGEMSQATYSNIADQSKSFYRYTLAPWLTSIEQRLNHSLAGPGQMYRFDTDGLLRPSLQDESSSYKSLIETGILSPNEVRERMGLGPREGGDAYISQTNNLSFGASDAEPQNEEAPDAEEIPKP